MTKDHRIPCYKSLADSIPALMENDIIDGDRLKHELLLPIVYIRKAFSPDITVVEGKNKVSLYDAPTCKSPAPPKTHHALFPSPPSQTPSKKRKSEEIGNVVLGQPLHDTVHVPSLASHTTSSGGPTDDYSFLDKIFIPSQFEISQTHFCDASRVIDCYDEPINDLPVRKAINPVISPALNSAMLVFKNAIRDNSCRAKPVEGGYEIPRVAEIEGLKHECIFRAYLAIVYPVAPSPNRRVLVLPNPFPFKFFSKGRNTGYIYRLSPLTFTDTHSLTHSHTRTPNSNLTVPAGDFIRTPSKLDLLRHNVHLITHNQRPLDPQVYEKEKPGDSARGKEEDDRNYGGDNGRFQNDTDHNNDNKHNGQNAGHQNNNSGTPFSGKSSSPANTESDTTTTSSSSSKRSSYGSGISNSSVSITYLDADNDSKVAGWIRDGSHGLIRDQKGSFLCSFHVYLSICIACIISLSRTLLYFSFKFNIFFS